jgi:hypothetical protein
MRVWLGLLLCASVAAADPVRALSVQDGKLAPDVVTSALAGFTVPAECATADKTVVAWVVYDHGKVVDAIVSKGDVEACVAKALRTTKLEAGAGRLGVALVVKVDKAAPKVAVLDDRNRKVLENILDKNMSTNLGKFTGIKSENRFGPGTGTGTAKGGDFVAGNPSRPTLKVGTPVLDENAWTADEIDRVIKARAGIFRACYQRSLHEHPDLAGKIVIRFRIVGDGNVDLAEVKSTSMHSVPVEECIKANVLRLRFPVRDGVANVNYPFVFSSGD